MAGIFLSYRREDSAAHAGRLYDRLVAHFGNAHVFMDVDAVELGEDFLEAIARTVGACDILIVLIGRNWLGAVDAAGRRRLDKPDDVVRMEIAAALDRNIRVVPALVSGAAMPTAEELPQPLARLATRNGLQIGDVRFHQDVDRLIEALERTVSPPPQGSLRAAVRKVGKAAYRYPVAIVVLAALAIAAIWPILSFREMQDATPVAAPRSDRADLIEFSTPPNGGLSGSDSSSPTSDVETMKVKRIIDANAQYYESGLGAVDPAMRRVKPNLGVLMVPVSQTLARALDLGRPVGAMISEVARRSSAAEAGLRRGDVILLFDRSPIRSVDDFENSVAAARPGTTVKLDVWRLSGKGVDTFSTKLIMPASDGAQAQFQRLRQTIDESNKEAKNIIQSIGR